MAALTCDIVTPVSKLFTDEAYMVVVPGIEGSMGFLSGHVPLVSPLADGIVRIQKENGGEAIVFALQGGYVQVTGEKVIVLANRAKRAEDIDAEAVKEQLAALEAKLEGMAPEEVAKSTISDDISWCKTQISAA